MTTWEDDYETVKNILQETALIYGDGTAQQLDLDTDTKCILVKAYAAPQGEAASEISHVLMKDPYKENCLILGVDIAQQISSYSWFQMEALVKETRMSEEELQNVPAETIHSLYKDIILWGSAHERITPLNMALVHLFDAPISTKTTYIPTGNFLTKSPQENGSFNMWSKAWEEWRTGSVSADASMKEVLIVDYYFHILNILVESYRDMPGFWEATRPHNMYGEDIRLLYFFMSMVGEGVYPPGSLLETQRKATLPAALAYAEAIRENCYAGSRKVS